MTPVALVCFALAAGLAAGGLAGSVAEAFTGVRVGFAPPYVRRGNPVASLAVSTVLGPFMLLNEALRAHDEGRIGSGLVATSAAISLGWALAAGIVLVFAATRIASLAG